MAQLIVSFGSEEEAQAAIRRLTNANIGEVRMRVLDSSEPLSHPKTSSTSPIITPRLGSIEVRPSERPKTPESMHEDEGEGKSSTIPTTGEGGEGVQVLIEVEDAQEAEAWRILGLPDIDSGERPGE
jgi:hypothetical protein